MEETLVSQINARKIGLYSVQVFSLFFHLFGRFLFCVYSLPLQCDGAIWRDFHSHSRIAKLFLPGNVKFIGQWKDFYDCKEHETKFCLSFIIASVYTSSKNC